MADHGGSRFVVAPVSGMGDRMTAPCRVCGEPAVGEGYELCERHWREIVGTVDDRPPVPRAKVEDSRKESGDEE